jgi:hypothetical protein
MTVYGCTINLKAEVLPRLSWRAVSIRSRSFFPLTNFTTEILSVKIKV